MPVPSNLYKIGRLMNLEQFITRVNAAMLQQAASMTLSGTASAEKNLAIFVLKNPFVNEISMIALVAADSTVLDMVTLNGDLAIIDNLTDDVIKNVVTQRWSLVASKYPVAPAQPSPTP